jgi:hypothetical protein
LLSVVTWLWQAFVLVAQSFLPALITPAHCSCFASSAETDVATDAAPIASRLVIAACNRFEFLIAVTPVVAVKARDLRGLIASADAREIAMAVPAAQAAW